MKINISSKQRNQSRTSQPIIGYLSAPLRISHSATIVAAMTIFFIRDSQASPVEHHRDVPCHRGHRAHVAVAYRNAALAYGKRNVSNSVSRAGSNNNIVTRNVARSACCRAIRRRQHHGIKRSAASSKPVVADSYDDDKIDNEWHAYMCRDVANLLAKS